MTSEARPVSDIRSAEPARVAIYDVAGRLVRRLDLPWGEGERRVTWDGNNGEGLQAASGIYFCRVRAGGMEISKKILLMR